MGGAVSLGGLRCAAAPSSIGLVMSTLAPPNLKAVQACVRFPVSSRFSAKDVCVPAIGRNVPCHSVATSVQAGPEGRVPAVDSWLAGGDATLEKLSDPAVEDLGCDAPLQVLIKLIAKEDSSQKRHQLSHVLGELVKEEQSVLSSLRKRNEQWINRRKPPSSRWSASGYDTDDGYDSDDGRNVEEDNPVPMKCRDQDDMTDATERYRDTVYLRNAWEAYVSRDSWEPPAGFYGSCDSSKWTRPEKMLDYFERCEIPEIKSAQLSRRKGWTIFLQDTPTLRSALEHHAKWGPDLEKQVQGILELWLVANQGSDEWLFLSTKP